MKAKKGKIAALMLLIILNAAVFLWNKQHDRVLTIKARGPQTIMITKNGFVPNRLIYKKGETISLVIHNQDNKEHNFALADYHVFSPNLNAGETIHIKFRAVKIGNFPFVSDTPGVPELGFKGTIVVQ
jgi:uncharacterized cupredoxin-like copper-binding protein